MKRFCQVITVLTILVVGAGFYRGCFAFTGDRETGDHHIDVKLSVDNDKVKHDAGAATRSLGTKDSHNE